MIMATEAYMAGYFKFGKIQEDKLKDAIMVKVQYVNRGVEWIKLETVFRDHRLRKLVKDSDGIDKKVCITYKYESPVNLLFCNYSKTLKNLDNNILKDLVQTKCACEYSPFLYKPAQHIITGDLSIVKNIELRKLFMKGAKYREPIPVNWETVLSVANGACQEYLNKVTKKIQLNNDNCAKYVELFMRIVNNRVNFYKRLNILKCRVKVTQKSEVQQELKKLQQHYIIAPADKAANNLIFICKKYYLQVMCEELGITKQSDDSFEATGNLVYEPYSNTETELLQKHKRFTHQIRNLQWNKENDNLPVIFATPKLHKNPYKFRFIAGASKSTTKAMAVLLYRILGHFKQHFQAYCRTINHRNGINCYWAIDSSIQMLNIIKNIKQK